MIEAIEEWEKREREKTWPPSRHLIFRGEGRKVLQTLLFENWIRTSVNGKREGVLSFGHALTENIPCDAKPQRGDYAVRPLIRVYAIAKLSSADSPAAASRYRHRCGSSWDSFSIRVPRYHFYRHPVPAFSVHGRTDGRSLLRSSKLVPLLFFQYLNWFSNKFWILYDATIVSSCGVWQNIETFIYFKSYFRKYRQRIDRYLIQCNLIVMNYR